MWPVQEASYSLTIISSLKQWARAIKRDAVALWLAARDPRVPCYAKVVAGAVAAYALSPIDLIPDFIPVLGYLDELIILPIGIVLAVKLVPAVLMAEFRAEAMRRGYSGPAERPGFQLEALPGERPIAVGICPDGRTPPTFKCTLEYFRLQTISRREGHSDRRGLPGSQA